MANLQHQLGSYVRPFLVCLGWGTNMAAITLWMIFQGFLLPFIPLVGVRPVGYQSEIWWLALYYSILVLISILPPMVIRDVGKSIIGFMLAYVIGGVIIYEVISLPSVNPGFRQLLISGAVSWTFTAIFPIPLFAGLLATIVGAGLGEHFELDKVD